MQLWQAVLVEQDWVVLSGLSAVVSCNGERGGNMIREDNAGLSLSLQRPIRDLLHQLPNFQVTLPEH